MKHESQIHQLWGLDCEYKNRNFAAVLELIVFDYETEKDCKMCSIRAGVELFAFNSAKHTS